MKNQNKKHQESKQKQFQVHNHVCNSYKTGKSTSLCIGNLEENIDLSRIHLAVQYYQYLFLKGTQGLM